MAERTDVRKLLVLRGPALEKGGIVDFLREHFDVEIAAALDDALTSMRREHFDAVLAETADFLPLERGIVTQQASVVLDTLADGVCVVSPEGRLVWANRRLREYPPAVLDPLRRVCVQAYQEFTAADAATVHCVRRFSLKPEDGKYFEVICSPVRDRAGNLRQIAAVVADATSQRRQQQKLNAIDRAGRQLVRLEYDAVSQRDAAQRLRMLEERIIRCSREVLDYQHFSVFVLDERTNRLNEVISEGMDRVPDTRGLLASIEGNGICGYVAATGRSYICQDVSKDSRYLKGLSDARSSLTVPLRLRDRVIGVMNVESDSVGAFGEEDRQFAEIFANYVAMALNILNLLVFERHTTHTQVSGSISAELAGPLNDIVSTATELMEDYIGHDDLRHRLTAIIDTTCKVRQFIKEITAPSPSGVMPSVAGGLTEDPVLSGKRVLVADDEELIRQTIRDVLVACGCSVDLAADGSQAADCIRRQRYDLVITDIKMPGASGYDVFAAAKSAHSRTGVILITGFGYDPNHSVVRANQAGLAAVLMKPFKVKQLLAECRQAVSS